MPAGRESALFILALCVAIPARAQTTPFITVDDFQSAADVTVGASMQGPTNINQKPACVELMLPCLTPPTVPDLGFVLSAAIYANSIIGIVGEVSTYDNKWASYDPNCDRRHSICAVEQSNHVRAALAGLKLRTPLITGWSTRGRFFVQALFGPQSSEIGPRQQAIQPGAGYDGYFRNGVAVRVEFDYRVARRGGRDLSTGRVFLGIAVPLGWQSP